MITNEHREIKGVFLFLLLLISPSTLVAQTTSYNQFSNEFQMARAINDKWAGEAWIGSAFSSTPEENKVFKTNIQRYAFLWGHYYFSSRWKFSSSLAYYYNKDVPEIGQFYSPEWRLTLQGVYYIHKIGYTLSTRVRGELRFMMNADGVYEDKYRYRQMLKYLQPLNSNTLRKGVFYFTANDEIFLKPNAKTQGVTFFDRNRLEIGGGYLVTDDLQLELTYVNEFLPRDNGNELYNVLSLTITVNNLLPRLKNSLTSKPEEVNQEE